MENYEDYTALILDTGSGYDFANGYSCQYGEILKAIAVISNEHIKNVFYDMSNKQYNVSLMEKNENRIYDNLGEVYLPTDEEIHRYPLPEFMGEQEKVSYALAVNLKVVIGEAVLDFLEKVVKLELSSIHKKMIDAPDGAVPDCFKNDRFKENAENILISKTIDLSEVGDYFGKSAVSYVLQLVQGKIYKIYTVNTLDQIIEIEIMNVIGTDIKYKRCPICKNLFADGTGRGQSRKYCDYLYNEERCSDIGQKFNNDHRPQIQKFYKKFYDKVRKYYSYHEQEINRNKKRDEIQPWEIELSKFYQALLELDLDYEEQVRRLNNWYEEKKKEVNEK